MPAKSTQELLEPIHAFLGCQTPTRWIEQAQHYPEELLIDHANCEKKAAGTALSLMFRYTDKSDLQMKMSKLAREELRHFEQVLQIMQKRGVNYRPVSASRYAASLSQHVRKEEPGQLVDKLIIGAIIEARSCERFAALVPELDEDLGKFYLSLLKSEARHFQDYLHLAQSYSPEDINDRIAFFIAEEARLVNEPDTRFRFHSGPISD
jgi:tRNA-(ms[2]io[6]A)-hydroxylase